MTNTVNKQPDNTDKNIVCNFIKNHNQQNTIFIGISNQTIENAHVDINAILINEIKKSKKDIKQLSFIFYLLNNQYNNIQLGQYVNPTIKPLKFQLSNMVIDNFENISSNPTDCCLYLSSTTLNKSNCTQFDLLNSCINQRNIIKDELCQFIKNPDVNTIILHVHDIKVKKNMSLDLNGYFNKMLGVVGSRVSKNFIFTFFQNTIDGELIMLPSIPINQVNQTGGADLVIKKIGIENKNVHFNKLSKNYYNSLSPTEQAEFNLKLYGMVKQGIIDLYKKKQTSNTAYASENLKSTDLKSANLEPNDLGSEDTEEYINEESEEYINKKSASSESESTSTSSSSSSSESLDKSNTNTNTNDNKYVAKLDNDIINDTINDSFSDFKTFVSEFNYTKSDMILVVLLLVLACLLGYKFYKIYK